MLSLTSEQPNGPALRHLRLRFLLLLILPTTLVVGGCTPHRDATIDGLWVRFADIVDSQDHQLTTDRISVPESLGLASFDHGWQQREGVDSGDPCMTLAGPVGRIRVFSADGDLEELELELSLGNMSAAQRLPVNILLNGSRLKRLHPEPEWSSYTVPVPREVAQRGVNTLELVPRSGKRRDPDVETAELRLRRVRFRSRSGRPLWPARPELIRDDGVIQVPVAGFLEHVVGVSRSSRLVGTYAFEMAEAGSGPAFAYVQLWNAADEPRTLLNRRFLRTVSKRQTLDLDLAPWAGRVVRLRVGVTGSGNGILRWRDLRVSAVPREHRTSSEPGLP